MKKSRLVVIGSFRAGGAGKTPFCLWLAKRLTARKKRVAILCHSKAFDEILVFRFKLQEQIQQGLAEVISTDNRYRTARKLDSLKDAPDFILCDDGFEDSRLRPHAIFRLDWEEAPTEIHQLIPAGKFRSLKQDHARDSRLTTSLRCSGFNPHVLFHIDSISNIQGAFPECRQSIAICGLGDPKRFFQDLKRAEFTPQKTIIRPDHDHGFKKYISAILHQNIYKSVVISEKDAFRLPAEYLKDPRVFIAKQSIQVQDEARAQIDQVLVK